MTAVQFSLTPTSAAILGLLRERPMHGYEVARHFRPEADLGQVAPADMSTIYTFLKDLQEQGLITGKRVTVGARPPRTVFSLTAEAQTLLDDWLHRPVARMREVRMDFLLKLYFARRYGAEQAAALIGSQIVACRSYVERLKASEAELDPASFEYVVLESKLTAAEGVLAWLERLAARQESHVKRAAIKRKRTRPQSRTLDAQTGQPS